MLVSIPEGTYRSRGNLSSIIHHWVSEGKMVSADTRFSVICDIAMEAMAHLLRWESSYSTWWLPAGMQLIWQAHYPLVIQHGIGHAQWTWSFYGKSIELIGRVYVRGSWQTECPVLMMILMGHNNCMESPRRREYTQSISRYAQLVSKFEKP